MAGALPTVLIGVLISVWFGLLAIFWGWALPAIGCGDYGADDEAACRLSATLTAFLLASLAVATLGATIVTAVRPQPWGWSMVLCSVLAVSLFLVYRLTGFGWDFGSSPIIGLFLAGLVGAVALALWAVGSGRLALVSGSRGHRLLWLLLIGEVLALALSVIL